MHTLLMHANNKLQRFNKHGMQIERRDTNETIGRKDSLLWLRERLNERKEGRKENNVREIVPLQPYNVMPFARDYAIPRAAFNIKGRSLRFCHRDFSSNVRTCFISPLHRCANLYLRLIFLKLQVTKSIILIPLLSKRKHCNIFLFLNSFLLPLTIVILI